MRRWIAIGDSLKILRKAGLQVRAVIDVGVQYDTEELRVGFPDVPHILFEPIQEYHDTIRSRYSDVDYQLFRWAVARAPGELILENVRADDAGVVSHVVNAEVDSAGTRRVRSVSLDAFLEEHPVPAPYLLKIDVDGSESDIMRGGVAAMRNCSCLIVETTLPMLSECCYLASLSGLRLWDIVDFNFYHGNLYQVDLVFVHESQVQLLPVLDPYEAINRGLDRSAWFAH